MIRFVSPETLQNAARVAMKVNLVEIAVLDIKAHASSPLSAAPEGPWTLKFSDVVEDVRRPSPESFEVPVQFSAWGVLGENGPELVRVDVKVLVQYGVLEGAEVSDDEVSEFADLNALFNAWPYARTLIHELSCRLSYPPMLMPLLVIKPRPQPQGNRAARAGQDA